MYLSDGQLLLIVIALLYLTECWIWVRGQSVAFVSSWGRWGVAAPKSWLGNSKGGVLLLNPLPPPGRVFVSHLAPISISPSGICAFNPQTVPSGVRPPGQSGRFLLFSDISSSITEGADLLVNNHSFAKCANAKQARRISKLINAMVIAKPVDREGMVRGYIANQFAADEAAAVLQEAAVIMRPLRWMCSISFLFLFVLTPILVSTLGLLRLFITVGVVLVLLTIQITILFYRAHTTLYEDYRSERVESAIKMVLCPPVAIRSVDFLTRNLLSEYSPVVVARLLARDGADELVRAFIRDLRHPLKHELSPEAAADIVSWASAEQLRHCLEYVQDTSQVFVDSTQPEGDSVSYCPRCRSQFVIPSGECPDCPGVARVAFSKSGQIHAQGAVSTNTDPS